MATGDVWEKEVLPGEEQARDSPGCGCESPLCHLPYDPAQINQALRAHFLKRTLGLSFLFLLKVQGWDQLISLVWIPPPQAPHQSLQTQHRPGVSQALCP